jgi:hypothetical protein
MTPQMIRAMKNPPLSVIHSARRRHVWVVKLVCSSKAQAERIEAFANADKARLKRGRQ